MRVIASSLLMLVIAVNCYPIERTEAQRRYDLAVSYIKSDLYEDGLKELNQVAFLYPDSSVADDALHQLALIREQVGDGEIIIGDMRRLEAVSEVVNRMYRAAPQVRTSKLNKLLYDILVILNADAAGKTAFRPAKEKAIVQYILALDYLNTLSERYPGSDKLEESKFAFERIIAKIDALIPKPKPPRSLKEKLIIAGCTSLFFLAFIALISGSSRISVMNR